MSTESLSSTMRRESGISVARLAVMGSLSLDFLRGRDNFLHNADGHERTYSVRSKRDTYSFWIESLNRKSRPDELRCRARKARRRGPGVRLPFIDLPVR